MKQVLNIAKYITGIVGAIGVLYGAFKLYDNLQDGQDDILETVEHINIEQSLMSEDIEGIKDTLERFEDKQDGIAKEIEAHHDAIENLGWAITNQGNFTPEQLEEILDRMLKKNNGIALTDGE
jgi:hypothetical protein